MKLIYGIFIVISSVRQLNHHHPLLVLASCIAIGELARCAPLPLPNGSSSSSSSSATAAAEGKSTAIWKLDLVKELFAIMNNRKLTTKVSNDS